jgi:hypothetical protein
MDILHELCDYMSDETVRAFKAAYPPLCSFLERTQLLEKRQLRCFFLGTPIDECTLGIGVNYDARTQTLSSGLDLLSEEAFVKFGVRRSIRKQEFSFFLPLALTKSHFARAKPRIYECLKTLNAEVALHERRRVVTPVLSTNPLPSRATSVAPRAVTRSAAAATISRPGAGSPGVRSFASDLESINVLFKLMNDLIKHYTRTAESILDAPSWSQRESLELRQRMCSRCSERRSAQCLATGNSCTFWSNFAKMTLTSRARLAIASKTLSTTKIDEVNSMSPISASCSSSRLSYLFVKMRRFSLLLIPALNLSSQFAAASTSLHVLRSSSAGHIYNSATPSVHTTAPRLASTSRSSHENTPLPYS